MQGPSYGQTVVSGQYDIVFVRGTTSSSESYVYRTDATDMIPNAVKTIAACVEAP